MRVLITGITGFVGSHLSKFLIEKGLEVFGTTTSIPLNPPLLKGDIGGLGIKIFKCDIRDAANIKEILSEIKPQRIYHLSAVSFPPDSLKNPRITYDVNFYGTMNLLDALISSGLNSKILFVGSSDEYGAVSGRNVPITEDCLLNPRSPYAVSKAAADLLSYYYFKTFGIYIIRARPFNHTGPGQRPDFVCSDFAKQVAEIECGIRKPVIYTGDLEAEKDFTDVRDIIRAYWLAIEKGVSGEVYNICSERSYSIRWILNTILSFTDVSVEIKEDSLKLRPADIKIIKGDCSKFKAVTGWKPTIPLEKTLEDLLNYWREKVSNRHSSFVTRHS